ncbi:MAG TPA: hypothetical protein V6D22_23375 [Candidatus Obscuribacterales bacterium]
MKLLAAMLCTRLAAVLFLAGWLSAEFPCSVLGQVDPLAKPEIMDGKPVLPKLSSLHRWPNACMPLRIYIADEPLSTPIRKRVIPPV